MMKRASTIYYANILVVISLSIIVVSCSTNTEQEDLLTSTEPTAIVTEDGNNKETNENILPQLDEQSTEDVSTGLEEVEQDDQLDYKHDPELKETTDNESSNKENSEGEKVEEDSATGEEISSEVIVKQGNLPKGFVYLDEVIPTAQFEMRYYSDYNFVGAQIDGYLAPLAIGTRVMADALLKVSNELEEMGYQLLIYDTYRPAKAVQQFLAWSKDTDDIDMKEDFYPNIDKATLFKSGYLSSKSGHSRGSTVDLTLIHKDTKQEVDMGSPYDLLDEISHFSTKLITDEQASNRQLLQDVMVKYGFKPYSKEWWHYVLKNEPYPSTYYDFDIQ
ncbi:M15 family metallopeptidase [Paenibacillus endoradicis]|uniref:M15 family metallopeptidase n=1 Tax=Paenibacillus endoradicis TaxID=2972487 RepID=UPI0021593003|nr:M15 family metallopeptidase [Paenibacillus endoradicis]MCR8657646.1 M15 family metallopeptidase [Paenibacillus endoradicis]